MNVALDLEEVLADTIQQSCQSTDAIDVQDFDQWNISDHTWQVYSGVSDALWRHDPMSIPTVEPSLSKYVTDIYMQVDRLDIVTARLHVDEQIESWLLHHNIMYDEIVSTDRPKYEYDYDLYIDDNPEMHGNCRLLLRHHPHNESIDAEGSKQTDRIHSLSEVVEYV